MTTDAAAVCHECVTIGAGRDALAGVLAYPLDRDVAGGVLIAGPHPLMGGNVSNNVVRTLRETLAALGLAVLSFDYRAPDALGQPGRDWATATSEFWRNGRCREELAWVADARRATEFIADGCGALQIALIGYSFGCWVVAQLAAERGATAFVLISPNPGKHDFAALAHSEAPLLVIQSDNDSTCPAEAGAAWFDNLRQPKTRHVWSDGEHFFRGMEATLAESVGEFLVPGD